jgi:peptide/nickel transport system permease protein
MIANETLRYASSRLITTLLIIFGAMLALFMLTTLVPGDPAKTLLGPQATPELAARFISEMGLDQPVHTRLWRFFSALATGNLGVDVVSGKPVWGLVRDVLPYTLILTFSSLALALLVGIPIGIYAATHRGSVIDSFLAFVSVAFIAMPSFVVAIFLLLIFAIWLDWLPVLGASRSGELWDEFRRMILPMTAIAIGWSGYFARITRSSMLEVLGEPYIRTSRAYGLPNGLVVYKYALKNACIPLLALLGFGIGRVIGNAIFIEVVFARPGIGRLIYEGISTRNYPVVQGAILVVVVIVVVVNLIIDLSYSAIDPRIRRDTGGSSLA